MQNLTTNEIEALEKVMGNAFAGYSTKGINLESELARPPTSSPESSKSFSPLPSTNSPISRAQFTQLQEDSNENSSPNPLPLNDIKIGIEAILGRTRLPLSKLMNLESGSIIPLEKLAGEPIEIEANGKLIAKGEVVIVEKNFGIKILEIIN